MFWKKEEEKKDNGPDLVEATFQKMEIDVEATINNKFEGEHEKYDKFKEPADKIYFLKRLYAILVGQFMTTVIMAMVPYFSDTAQAAILSLWWLMLIFAGVAFLIQLINWVKRPIVAQFPFNWVFMIVFSFSFSFIIMYLGSCYIAKMVLILSTFSASVVVGLGLYVLIKMKQDFSWIGSLIALFLSLIGMMVICYFCMDTSTIENIIGAAGIIYLGFYLIYETRQIISAGRYNLAPQEYVVASLIIYLDIIILPISLIGKYAKKCCCACCKKKDGSA